MRNHADTLPYQESMTYIDMANDLQNFIESTVKSDPNNKEIAVLGHSMGGKTCMILALLHVSLIQNTIDSTVF